MIELRKDYIFDRWSYIAADRGKRPVQFENNNKDSKEKVCYFCPGNENLTPPEIGRIGNGEKWSIRWFPNKFPITEAVLDKIIVTDNSYYTNGSAFGYHEVIAETPDHEKQLAELSIEEFKEVLKVYAVRMKDLESRENIKYVQIFKNHGDDAGTSLIHTHTQITATNIVPKLVKEKIEAIKKYDNCPYCDVIFREEKSERSIYSNDDFIVFCPYAPRFNYEAWIFPKKHYLNITNLSEKEFDSLSISFNKILLKLGKINAPYNFYLHYSPKGENLHFHFEITPRMNKWAGFELATDSYVITTSPEEAARFYRE